MEEINAFMRSLLTFSHLSSQGWLEPWPLLFQALLTSFPRLCFMPSNTGAACRDWWYFAILTGVNISVFLFFPSLVTATHFQIQTSMKVIYTLCLWCRFFKTKIQKPGSKVILILISLLKFWQRNKLGKRNFKSLKYQESKLVFRTFNS